MVELKWWLFDLKQIKNKNNLSQKSRDRHLHEQSVKNIDMIA